MNKYSLERSRNGFIIGRIADKNNLAEVFNFAPEENYMSEEITKPPKKETQVSVSVLLKAWELMSTAKAMTDLFEKNKEVTAKYVHATSRGHEAIQIACGLQLQPQDFVFP